MLPSLSLFELRVGNEKTRRSRKHSYVVDTDTAPYTLDVVRDLHEPPVLRVSLFKSARAVGALRGVSPARVPQGTARGPCGAGTVIRPGAATAATSRRTNEPSQSDYRTDSSDSVDAGAQGKSAERPRLGSRRHRELRVYQICTRRRPGRRVREPAVRVSHEPRLLCIAQHRPPVPPSLCTALLLLLLTPAHFLFPCERKRKARRDYRDCMSFLFRLL